MMSPRRVVLVMRAEGLLVPKRESEAADQALDELEALIRRPEPQTTLVFVAGSIDKRSRMYKLLTRQATCVEVGAIQDRAEGERWIRNRVQAAGSQIDPQAAKLLAERSWNDVKRLRNDVERLLLYTLGEKSIALADVRELIGPAALQDDWAMTNAVEAGNAAEALRQLALLLDDGAPPEKVLGQLAWMVRAKVPVQAPGRLRASVDAVFRTDLDLKRTANDPRALLERLVVELCRADRTPPHGRRVPGG